MWHLTKNLNGGAANKKGIELQGENLNSEILWCKFETPPNFTGRVCNLSKSKNSTSKKGWIKKEYNINRKNKETKEALHFFFFNEK